MVRGASKDAPRFYNEKWIMDNGRCRKRQIQIRLRAETSSVGCADTFPKGEGFNCA